MNRNDQKAMHEYDDLYSSALDALSECLARLHGEIIHAQWWSERDADRAWDCQLHAHLVYVSFIELLTAYEDGLWKLCHLMCVSFDSERFERDILSAYLFEHYELVA